VYEISMDIHPTLEQLKDFVLTIETNVLNNLKPFWDGVASKLVAEEIARCFVTQGYGTWSPLSPKYAMLKSRIYPGKTILRRKDVYFRAVTRRGQVISMNQVKTR